MRLIDADALSDKVFMANCGLPDCGRETCERCCIEPAMKFIEDAPTVDPVRHGYWVFNGKPIEKWSHGNYCSVCGEYSETCGNYCPYCGAEMD